MDPPPPADAVTVGMDAPAPPADAAPAPLDAPVDAPAPDAPPAPVVEAADWDATPGGPAPADQPQAWALHAPLPLDPPLPDPSAPLPAPAPADPAPADAGPAPVAAPAPDPLAPLNGVNIPQPALDAANQAVTNGGPVAPPDGIPHLASPDALPPGSTMDPSAAGNDGPNTSYLKDLWQAVQNHDISGKDALLMGLAQRGMNTPYPEQAGGPNVPTAPAPADPALPPPPPGAPGDPALPAPPAPAPAP
jgi:hypothetical protein